MDENTLIKNKALNNSLDKAINLFTRQDYSGEASDLKEIKDLLNNYLELVKTEGAIAGLPYGIIDPDYARAYTVIRHLAWEEGYGVGMHGSFTRDLDLILVPWTESACSPERLIKRICASNLKLIEQHSNPGIKPHGRLAYTLLFKEFGDPRFIDISFTPRLNVTNEKDI